MLLGATSLSLFSMACRKLSAVSLMPSTTSLYRSVLAVHSTMTLSTPEEVLNSRMFLLISSICSHHGRIGISATSRDEGLLKMRCLPVSKRTWSFFEPLIRLSALASWLAAMKSGL